MDHDEMVELIRAGVPPGGVWADLGAGTGNFTWALAEMLGSGATIYALDRDRKSIDAIVARMAADPPRAMIIPRQADVVRPLALPPLDGILMANLLHFIRDQSELLRRLRTELRSSGRLIIVEYEEPAPIPWVPFPAPFARIEALAAVSGLGAPIRIGIRRSPSSGRVMYAAMLRRLETMNDAR